MATPTHSAPAYLETLPAELKCKVLYQIADRATLKALVHASPAYHNLYLSDRVKIYKTANFRELCEKHDHINNTATFKDFNKDISFSKMCKSEGWKETLIKELASVPTTYWGPVINFYDNKLLEAPATTHESEGPAWGWWPAS